MDESEILIVPSKSRLDLERIKYKESCPSSSFEDYLQKRYLTIREEILESDKRQKENIKYFKKIFPKANWLEDRSELITNQKNLTEKIVISLGGDEHFKWVASHTNKPILSFILDNRKNGSKGSLVCCMLKEAPIIKKQILTDKYTLQNWPKIEITTTHTIHHKKIIAISEVFLGEKERVDMSRFDIVFKGKSYPRQKNSGILIVNGAGSSPGSWYNSLIKESFHYLENKLSLIQLEQNESDFKKIDLYLDEEIEIISYNDSNGIIIPDTIKEKSFNFPIGEKATIKLSKETLKVIVLNS